MTFHSHTKSTLLSHILGRRKSQQAPEEVPSPRAAENHQKRTWAGER